MKEKIKEIQDYFIQKILSDEFTVVKIDAYTATIRIDDQYDFNIWICNNPENRRIYEHELSFMEIYFTKGQAIQVDKLLKKYIDEHNAKELRTTKLAQFKKLQEELTNGGLI